MTRRVFVLTVWLIATICVRLPAAPPPRTGDVAYEPAADESMVAESFRLEAHRFTFEQQFVDTSSKKIFISRVTFPSPVTTPHANNNTVHCEYFRPIGAGPFPGAIVLHILGGDFDLSRLIGRTLASHGVAALFVKLPYYGPRAQAGADVSMISEDPRQTVAGMKQAVLDLRRATAWLGAQEEVDSDDLGIIGISLGGITAALAATAEPRLNKIFLMLAGGDVAQIGWESPIVAGLRDRWIAQGGTKESLIELLREVDPVTYGSNVHSRKIVMCNALDDKVIPRASTESLWRAFGEPEIIWVDGGHYTAARFLFDVLARATRFFRSDAED